MEQLTVLSIGEKFTFKGFEWIVLDKDEDGVFAIINIYSRKAPNNQSKLARIIQFAPDIRKFYFIAPKYQSKEYKKFMSEVTTFVQTGKNPHDDAPDSLAMLADELFHGISEVRIFQRPY